MKKLLSVALAMFVALVGIIVPIVTAESATADTSVSVTDPQFRKLLNLALGKSNPDSSITTSEMANLTELSIGLDGGTQRNASYGKITSLKGLESAKNLRTLIVHGSYKSSRFIENLDAIGSLSSLEDLIIEHVKNFDLRFLERARNLRNIEIYDVPMDSVEGFQNLTKLRSLTINYANLRDVSYLGKLSGLSEIDLRYNQILDVSPLSGKNFKATNQSPYLVVRSIKFSGPKNYGKTTYSVSVKNGNVVRSVGRNEFEMKDYRKAEYRNLISFKSSDGRHSGELSIKADVVCTSGWVGPTNNRRYMYSNCTYARNTWKNDGTKRYYLNNNGVAVKGLMKIDKHYYIFDPGTGVLWQNRGLTYYRGANYYIGYGNNPQGHLSSGWVTINGRKYYFSSDSSNYGQMIKGWRWIRGSYYYFHPQGNHPGAMATGAVNINGSRYYFHQDGRAYSGWVGGKYYRNNGSLATGWISINGVKHYFRSDGTSPSGWQSIGNNRYYFWSSSNWARNYWLNSHGSRYYFDYSGIMVRGWKTINGKRYYFNQYGALQTGWHTLGGNRYYFDSNGVMRTGWVSMGGRWYYFNSNGTMATGWAKVGGVWYYLYSDGVMATGWLKLGGTWYYLKGSGAMATGWQYVGGAWYYLKSWGGMATGWQYVGGAWYYLKSWGGMATGWQYLGGTWYYLKGSGAMATGWQYIGGAWYRFNGSGAWVG